MTARTWQADKNAIVSTTQYVVAPVALQGDEEQRHWSLTVQQRGDGRWGVYHGDHRGGICLSLSGEWHEEPGDPSEEWLAKHRFNNSEPAIWTAVYALPEVRLNGLTAEEAAVRKAAR